MTAAGVSSLLVARRALQRKGEYTGNQAWQVDRKIEAGLGWMGANWKTYLRQHRWTYYGLYSVEKVGDIGGIKALGAVDWYAEGARFIVAKQNRDGTWGDEADTALALLFLTRATRSHLQTTGPPVLFTRLDGAGGESESDLVYIEAVKGFVAAQALFDFCAETRDPKLIPVIDQAIFAYPPHRVHEILFRVVALWTDERDHVTRFAAKAAKELAGLSSENRGDFETVVKNLRRMRGLEQEDSVDAEEVKVLLVETKSEVLKKRALELIDRLGLAAAFDAVIEKLVDPSPTIRRRAHEILTVWTGQKFPPPPESPGKAVKRDVLAQAAAPWRKWWEEHGEGFRSTREANSLVEQLREEEDPKGAEKIVRALVALGPRAAPSILEAMEHGEYTVQLVIALEAITGRSVGLRASDWKEIVRRIRRENEP
jgi:hypothetical protein